MKTNLRRGKRRAANGVRGTWLANVTAEVRLMLPSPQTKLPLFCVYLALMIATGCSRNASDDSPTAPSQPTGTVGAVIAGTVMSGQASVGGARALGSSDSLPSAGSTLAGLTVQVVGSSLSAIVSAAGA